MAAKCNIITSLEKKLNQLRWGVPTGFDEDIVLENYIEYLNCSEINLVVCNPDNCINEAINFTCTLSITKISATIVENLVTFFIADGDIVNGLAPFSYNWDFEEDDFDNAGTIDTNSAVLTVKPSKNINLLVSKIILTITDSNGCIVTKSCYLAIGQMQCSSNYLPCTPVTALVARNKIVQCPKVSGLLVFKKS